ncbi:GNAT family N-acetyltransferase [Pseudonocardia acaciae]|uniref:GNAT family N-acetyltransferase n=1 Tax=Pseudonocardia acaciae TaxID=551276 RepID=UPI00055D619B|nr:GNAT family N-acetyltransferase [Pseudonocardia acaciae]
MTAPAALTIRPYRETDHDAIYDICVRTGDRGDDISEQLHDPRLLPDLFVGPYLALEPELAFVLAAVHRPVGYILGTADTARFVAAYRERWLPRVARPSQAPSDEWLVHLLNRPEWMSHPELADEYPAHLHIDLLPEARGNGYGRALIETFRAALRTAGVPGMHLTTGVSNSSAQRFYRRVGFVPLPQEPPKGAIFMGQPV